MTTKQVRAQKLSTRDKLVVPGKLRREALPICEVCRSGSRVEIVAHDGYHFRRLAFGLNDLVRVKS